MVEEKKGGPKSGVSGKGGVKEQLEDLRRLAPADYEVAKTMISGLHKKLPVAVSSKASAAAGTYALKKGAASVRKYRSKMTALTLKPDEPSVRASPQIRAADRPSSNWLLHYQIRFQRDRTIFSLGFSRPKGCREAGTFAVHVNNVNKFMPGSHYSEGWMKRVQKKRPIPIHWESDRFFAIPPENLTNWLNSSSSRGDRGVFLAPGGNRLGREFQHFGAHFLAGLEFHNGVRGDAAHQSPGAWGCGRRGPCAL